MRSGEFSCGSECLVERQVLKTVERIVVDEIPDWRLCREDVLEVMNQFVQAGANVLILIVCTHASQTPCPTA